MAEETQVAQATSQTTTETTVSQEERLAALEAKLATLAAENATLKGSVIATAAANKTPVKYDKEVKVGDKSYKFNHIKAIIPGIGEVTSEDAAVNTELLATIVAIPGQNFLTEVK